MPRPAARAIISPPSRPVQTIPDDLRVLRQQWKWAAFCQFFVTFAPVFAMEDVTITDIENDLVHSTSVVIPRVMLRMLYCLTYDRKISLDTWQAALLKQYFKRDPQANPLGGEPRIGRYSKSIEPATLPPTPRPEDVENAKEGETRDEEMETPEPASKLSMPAESRQTSDDPVNLVKDWLQLSMLEKLDSMHLLTEWQFQNPTRLRQIMKNDDEGATWRAEPIGFDAKKNAYWLIGEDRLWVQRHPPRPNLKRKRPPVKTNSKQAKKTKRYRDDPPPKPKPSRVSAQATDAPTGRGAGRAAKLQAKQKLDAQAKELAELNRQAAAASSSSSPRSTRRNAQISTPSPSKMPGRPTPNSRPLGTRLSLRLRRTMTDEWQSVPDEWLQEAEPKPSVPKLNLRKTGLESDADTISDLTELSEATTPKEEPEADKFEAPPEDEPSEDAENDEPVHPADFVEWETIAVTLEEWQHVAEPFAKATHYSEKALYKVLNIISPVVIEQLQEIRRQRRMEDAITHRKRSSRIAIKESEKEEARLAAKRRAEEEEKLSRARRAEARQQKEEADRQRRENARELRRKEREAKDAQTAVHEESAAPSVKDESGEPGERAQPQLAVNGSASGSGSRTPSSDWELDCEICQRHGINLDDGTPMMSCGSCSKWQHINCHDRADSTAGRPKRNWDVVEFLCQKCKAARGTNGQHRTRPTTTVINATLNGVSGPVQLTAPYQANGPYKMNSGTAAPYRSYPAQSTNSYQPASYSNQPALTFSHYQPQQRVFMPSQVHQPYGASAVHQPYGISQNGLVPPRPLNPTTQGWTPAAQAHSYYNSSSERSSETPTWRASQPQSQPVPANGSWYPPISPAPPPLVSHPSPSHNQVTPPSQHYPT